MIEDPYHYSLTTRLKEKDVIVFLDIKKDSVLLDIGCGLGYFLNKISNNKPVKMIGIDADYQSIKYCKMRLSNFFVSADAQNLPFKNNTFDRILYSDVIEHVADDRASLGEIKRISKNSAVVVITTEAREGLFTGTKLNMLGHDVRGTPEYHVRDGYYFKELKHLLHEQNFELMDHTFFSYRENRELSFEKVFERACAYC